MWFLSKWKFSFKPSVQSDAYVRGSWIIWIHSFLPLQMNAVTQKGFEKVACQSLGPEPQYGIWATHITVVASIKQKKIGLKNRPKKTLWVT